MLTFTISYIFFSIFISRLQTKIYHRYKSKFPESYRKEKCIKNDLIKHDNKTPKTHFKFDDESLELEYGKLRIVFKFGSHFTEI